MKKRIFAIVLFVSMLTGCSESVVNSIENDYVSNESQITSTNNTASSSTTPAITEESNVQQESTSQSNNDQNDSQNAQNTKTKYIYDMFHHRTLWNEFGEMYCVVNDGLCYIQLNPEFIDYGSYLVKKDNSQSTFCAAFDNCIYYQTGGDYSDTRIMRNINGEHIKKYDASTQQTSVVVGGEGYGSYCLDEKYDIYGMTITEKKIPVEYSDGSVDVRNEYLCSLVRIQEGQNTYEIVVTFDAQYEYILVGVYENKAYFLKKESDKYYSPGVYSEGKEHGLIEYDLLTQTERVIYRGRHTLSSCFMTLYNGELSFFYDDDDHHESYELHRITLNGNDTVVYSSANLFSIEYGPVTIYNDTIYIGLDTSSVSDHIVYAITDGKEEYMGIFTHSATNIFINPFTGQLSRIDALDGNLEAL